MNLKYINEFKNFKNLDKIITKLTTFASKIGVVVNIVSYDDNTLLLDTIDSNVKGAGSKFMEFMCELGDENKVDITLIPAGSSKRSRKWLIEWYKSFGFEITSDTKYKYMVRFYKTTSNITENIEINTSDVIRKECIELFLMEVENDIEYNTEDVELGSLLDMYDGYEWQTYIQNIIPNEKFILYEGFSAGCWRGFKQKIQYKGLSKPDIIKKFINERGSKLALDYGYTMTKHGFEFYDGFDCSDYYLYMVYEKIK